MNDEYFRHATPSYWEHRLMYLNQEIADYSWMCYLTHEAAEVPPRAKRTWMKWKALYAHGTDLTTQEMRIRLTLAQRYEAIKKMDTAPQTAPLLKK